MSAPALPPICPNCSATVCGPFCAQCGQETVIEKLTLRIFSHEYVQSFVSLDSRLWRTLRVLLIQPGELTQEFLRGRRRRYARPLPLYLSASFVLFVLTALFAGNLVQVNDASGPDAAQGIAAGKRTRVQGAADDAAGNSASVSANVSANVSASSSAGSSTSTATSNSASSSKSDAASNSGKSLFRADIKIDDADDGHRETEKISDALSKSVDRAPEWFKPVVRRYQTSFAHWRADPQRGNLALSQAFIAKLPYAVFFMVPMFAVLTLVLYWRRQRNYAEHFLFALHFHAFVFICLIAIYALPLTEAAIPLILLVWWVYLGSALRTVFGGRRWPQLLRGALLFPCHAMFLSFAVVVALLFSAITI